MNEPRAHSAAAGGAVEAALLAVAAPGRQDLGPPRVLPPGAIDLIRVAAEDRPHAEQLAARFGVDVRRIEDAALHFVHAVMFHPDSDHFRVLGVRPDDDEETLKLHFRWLQKWLHPDRDPEGWVSVYAERVNIAWASLRRADRRADYRNRLAALDESSGRVPPAPAAAAAGPAAMDSRVPASVASQALISSRWVRRLPAIVIGVGLALAVALFAAHRAGENLLAAERSARERVAVASVPPGVAWEPAQAGPAARQERVDGAEVVSSAPANARSRDAAPVAVAWPGGLPPASAGTERASQPSLPDRSVADESLDLAGPARERDEARTVSAARSMAGGGPSPVADRFQDDDRPDVMASPVPAAASVPSGMLNGPSVPARAPVGPARLSVESPRQESGGDAGVVERAEAPRARPLATVATTVAANATVASTPPAGGDQVVAELPRGAVADGIITGDSPAERGPTEPETGFDPSVGRSVLNRFSSAYRDGQVQQVVLLFAPNARTPEGNLVNLHERYGSLFAASSRRSLEFVELEWRALPNGLEGVGRYEWAMRPRGAGGTQSSSGRVRVVIEYFEGRPLIVLLDQRDVG